MDKDKIIELLTSDKVKRSIEIADGVFISGELVKEIVAALEQSKPGEVCEDVISRKEVLNYWNLRWNDKEIYKAIYNMPPVQPIRPKAYWILHRDMMGNKYGECSNCHKIQYAGSLNYCPYCGHDTKDSEWHRD